MLLNHKVMNIFDIITLIFAIVAVFLGWRKGFIKQLCSLIGIVGGIAIAIAVGGDIGTMLGIDAAYAKPLGFIITLVVSVIAASLVAKVVSSIFSAIGLGGLDTLAGIALSLIKFLLILSVAYVAIEKINKEVKLIDEKHFTDSETFRPVTAVSERALEAFNTFSK